MCSSTALLRDRVYIVKPMLPWAGWALTPPFHPYLAAVYLCCTCPGVTPGGRYPLSLPYEARTFLIWSLSASIRGCPTRSRKYCTPRKGKCQTLLQILFKMYILYRIVCKINGCLCAMLTHCSGQWIVYSGQRCVAFGDGFQSFPKEIHSLSTFRCQLFTRRLRRCKQPFTPHTGNEE